MSGAEAMDQMVARVAALAELPARTAEEARAAVEGAAKASASAGTTPEGETWAPRKSDGGRPLVNAASSIVVRVVKAALGTTLQVVVRGHHFFHTAGKGSGKKAHRKIIPDATDTVPASYAEAIRGAAAVAFGKITGGR